MEDKKSNELERFKQEEFVDKIADHNIFLFKCTKCGGTHFRHAGYMETMIPFVDPKDGAKVATDSKPVKLCVSCKSAFITHEGKFVDVTPNIDLKAWEKTEEEVHDITGPGGQC